MQNVALSNCLDDGSFLLICYFSACTSAILSFFLEDSDKFFAFLLTVGQALYKYMRIYLWTFVWQVFVLCEMYSYVKL